MNTLGSIIRAGATKYATLCRKAHVGLVTASVKYATVIMLVLGVALVAGGIETYASANTGMGNLDLTGGPGNFGQQGRLTLVVNRAFNLIEGNIGAIVMVAAGLLAIISAAMGAYKMAISLLVIAVASFILRSLVRMFFNWDGSGNSGQFSGNG